VDLRPSSRNYSTVAVLLLFRLGYSTPADDPAARPSDRAPGPSPLRRQRPEMAPRHFPAHRASYSLTRLALRSAAFAFRVCDVAIKATLPESGAPWNPCLQKKKIMAESACMRRWRARKMALSAWLRPRLPEFLVISCTDDRAAEPAAAFASSSCRAGIPSSRQNRRRPCMPCMSPRPPTHAIADIICQEKIFLADSGLGAALA